MAGVGAPLRRCEKSLHEPQKGNEVKEADEDGGVLEREPRLPAHLVLHLQEGGGEEETECRSRKPLFKGHQIARRGKDEASGGANGGSATGGGRIRPWRVQERSKPLT